MPHYYLLLKGWGELRRADWGSQGLHACSWLQDLGHCCLLISDFKPLLIKVIWRTLIKVIQLLRLISAKMNFLAKVSLRQLPRVCTRLPIISTPKSPQVQAAGLHTGCTVFGTFEPDYLDTEGNTIPTYPPLNIQVRTRAMTRWFESYLIHVQIKGYNFDLLEEYQSWVHRMAENMVIHLTLF